MKNLQKTPGIEINPKFVGALFTERNEDKLRVFCFFTNGGTSQFDLAADENLSKLLCFYSKLNMDETCASVIQDEVVQGRVYVRSRGKCWIYTLLSTPGKGLPLFDGDIGDLPWKDCWRSQSADVLEYGKPGDYAHCFAVRTQISEQDATRLLKDSRVFINPLSFPKKKPHRRPCLGIGVGIACLGMLVVLAVFYVAKYGAKEPGPATIAAGAAEQTSAARYCLLSNHQISGPYPVTTIGTMNAGGLLNAETLCRPENATDWVRLDALFPSQLRK